MGYSSNLLDCGLLVSLSYLCSSFLHESGLASLDGKAAPSLPLLFLPSLLGGLLQAEKGPSFPTVSSSPPLLNNQSKMGYTSSKYLGSNYTGCSPLLPTFCGETCEPLK
uniref:Uncharacterized protein n=2 Tax=Picea TaxID=3328 RepID=A0A117NHY6_PICGL|nr:hypothetical protein ABT39_MTgene3677 [Picea glauca]QHR91381.1 hypothetical protein Q903MT_gene5415 [Picea sitchensis]